MAAYFPPGGSSYARVPPDGPRLGLSPLAPRGSGPTLIHPFGKPPVSTPVLGNLFANQYASPHYLAETPETSTLLGTDAQPLILDGPDSKRLATKFVVTTGSQSMVGPSVYMAQPVPRPPAMQSQVLFQSRVCLNRQGGAASEPSTGIAATSPIIGVPGPVPIAPVLFRRQAQEEVVPFWQEFRAFVHRHQTLLYEWFNSQSSIEEADQQFQAMVRSYLTRRQPILPEAPDPVTWNNAALRTLTPSRMRRHLSHQLDEYHAPLPGDCCTNPDRWNGGRMASPSHGDRYEPHVLDGYPAGYHGDPDDSSYASYATHSHQQRDPRSHSRSRSHRPDSEVYDWRSEGRRTDKQGWADETVGHNSRRPETPRSSQGAVGSRSFSPAQVQDVLNSTRRKISGLVGIDEHNALAAQLITGNVLARATPEELRELQRSLSRHDVSESRSANPLPADHGKQQLAQEASRELRVGVQPLWTLQIDDIDGTKRHIHVWEGARGVRVISDIMNEKECAGLESFLSRLFSPVEANQIQGAYMVAGAIPVQAVVASLPQNPDAEICCRFAEAKQQAVRDYFAMFRKRTLTCNKAEKADSVFFIFEILPSDCTRNYRLLAAKVKVWYFFCIAGADIAVTIGTATVTCQPKKTIVFMENASEKEWTVKNTSTSSPTTIAILVT